MMGGDFALHRHRWVLKKNSIRVITKTELINPGGEDYFMGRKALLSVILSAAMILGSASPAFAAGQLSSDEVTASTESQDDVVIEDDSSEQEAVDIQAADEEVVETESESEEDGIEEENTDEESKPEADTTDSTEEEEEKPEALVGAEGERVSVGENVTAGFDSETGTVTFYSQGGTLSKSWISMLGINSTDILKVTISNDSDVLYLPADSTGLFSISSLQSVNLSKADTSNVTNMYAMFVYCSSLQTLDLSGFDTSNVTNMSAMFHKCTSLQTLDVSGFDTSNVTDMSMLFYECKSLQTLDVSGFDTTNVTSMLWMFFGCSSLQTLDVSGFDTTNVTTMKGMFQRCSSLQTLDLSGFDTSNVTDMSLMFSGSSGLETLELSGFDTSNVTNMSSMFEDCASLLTLDLRGFNTSNVTNMYRIFANCSSLQKLDLSSFDLGNVNPGYMLLNCNNLLVLMTPVNVHGSERLPDTFVDASGTEYYSLPQGLSESIRITKKGAVIIFSISDDYYGKTGTMASFHVEAADTGNISYQWQYRTAGMTDWKTPGQASAQTANYTFKLKPSYDNIEVRCIVSNDSGDEVISETRKANVFAFTSQPADVTAAEGQDVNFEVSAIGRNVTYQWYYKRPNSTWKKTTKEGSKTAVLPITAGTVNNGTSYRCVITDEEGNQITSSAARLTLDNVIPLQVTGISENAYDVNGESVTFHIDAVGNGDLTYQWQYKLAGESTWRTPGQASAKTADYIFKLRPSYDNIEVRCIVKDAVGNSVTSDVRKANVFAVTQHPNTVYAELGDSVTFAVEGIGQNLTYQWYYRRLEGDWKKVTAAGGNTASLTIIAQVKNNYSQYRCYVYDGLGNLIKSRAAMLIEENEEYEG